jgi:hypothetical protein
MIILLKVYLCAMCFIYVYNSIHKIAKYSSYSEILRFVIFRKKLAQKSSVFVNLGPTNITVDLI